MKLENTTYYEGFEGEPELALAYGEEKFIMWIGYFEAILDALLQSNLPQEGILKEYFYHEGWYDDSPWEIPDTIAMIEQLKEFNIEMVNQSEPIKKILPDIVEELIQFLESALQEQVVIEYD